MCFKRAHLFSSASQVWLDTSRTEACWYLVVLWLPPSDLFRSTCLLNVFQKICQGLTQTTPELSHSWLWHIFYFFYNGKKTLTFCVSSWAWVFLGFWKHFQFLLGHSASLKMGVCCANPLPREVREKIMQKDLSGIGQGSFPLARYYDVTVN